MKKSDWIPILITTLFAMLLGWKIADFEKRIEKLEKEVNGQSSKET